jgi:glucokinase
VGVAGQLLEKTGRIAVAPNLKWRDVPFGEMLSEKLGHPVRVVNDLSAAAWGELRAGAGKGTANLFVVFVGSGVGSAIIADTRLVTGETGVAGEFGHIKVAPETGRFCGCGERGCLEAYAGGHNLIIQMREVLDSDRDTKMREMTGGDESKLTPVVLEEAAFAGDPAAKEIFDRAMSYLTLAIANQVSVLNPGKLILGGGVLGRCAGMRKQIAQGVEKYSTRTSRNAVKVVDAALGDDSGLIGAALLAAEQ